MASTRKCPYATRLRKGFNTHSHAMPFGLIRLCIFGTSEICSGPIFVDAQGQSVPISGGSPPIS